MVFFTDGIITAANAGGAAYTDYTLYHTVTIIMANYPNLSARDMIKRIGRSVREHVGDQEQHRDQALLTFTYKGAREERPSPTGERRLEGNGAECDIILCFLTTL